MTGKKLKDVGCTEPGKKRKEKLTAYPGNSKSPNSFSYCSCKECSVCDRCVKQNTIEEKKPLINLVTRKCHLYILRAMDWLQSLHKCSRLKGEYYHFRVWLCLNWITLQETLKHVKHKQTAGSASITVEDLIVSGGKNCWVCGVCEESSENGMISILTCNSVLLISGLWVPCLKKKKRISVT